MHLNLETSLPSLSLEESEYRKDAIFYRHKGDGSEDSTRWGNRDNHQYNSPRGTHPYIMSPNSLTAHQYERKYTKGFYIYDSISDNTNQQLNHQIKSLYRVRSQLQTRVYYENM